MSSKKLVAGSSSVGPYGPGDPGSSAIRRSNSSPKVSATASSTVSAAPTTSGPMPSPGSTPTTYGACTRRARCPTGNAGGGEPAVGRDHRSAVTCQERERRRRGHECGTRLVRGEPLAGGLRVERERDEVVDELAAFGEHERRYRRRRRARRCADDRARRRSRRRRRGRTWLRTRRATSGFPSPSERATNCVMRSSSSKRNTSSTGLSPRSIRSMYTSWTG